MGAFRRSPLSRGVPRQHDARAKAFEPFERIRRWCGSLRLRLREPGRRLQQRTCHREWLGLTGRLCSSTSNFLAAEQEIRRSGRFTFSGGAARRCCAAHSLRRRKQKPVDACEGDLSRAADLDGGQACRRGSRARYYSMEDLRRFSGAAKTTFDDAFGTRTDRHNASNFGASGEPTDSPLTPMLRQCSC